MTGLREVRSLGCPVGARAVAGEAPEFLYASGLRALTGNGSELCSNQTLPERSAIRDKHTAQSVASDLIFSCISHVDLSPCIGLYCARWRLSANETLVLSTCNLSATAEWESPVSSLGGQRNRLCSLRLLEAIDAG